MERRSAEDSGQPIREESRSHIYTRGGTRQGKSKKLLALIGAVSVLPLLGVLGLRQFNEISAGGRHHWCGDHRRSCIGCRDGASAEPANRGCGPPAIDASALAATTAVQPPPKAPIRVDDSPRPAVSDGPRNSIRPSNLTSARTPTVTVGERPNTVAGRSTPPPATSTERSTAEPPTPVASSPPAATTATPAPEAPTPQPAATRETAPDSAPFASRIHRHPQQPDLLLRRRRQSPPIGRRSHDW